MIDIDNVKEEFKKFVANYNPSNSRIALKIGHTIRVAENSKLLAQNLDLSEEEIKLAQAIGYFHDLGRFEQIRIANTFSDKDSGINHGEMSVKILSKNNYIRNFIKEDTYDNIIKTAILNHNQKFIDENLSGKELLFSKIIRDADKIDILYTICLPESTMQDILNYDSFNIDKINENLIKELKTEHYLSYSEMLNNADSVLAFYAYIFDLYFDYSLKIIKDKRYLDSFTDKVISTFESDTIHNQIKDVLAFCNDYLKKY